MHSEELEAGTVRRKDSCIGPALPDSPGHEQLHICASPGATLPEAPHSILPILRVSCLMLYAWAYKVSLEFGGYRIIRMGIDKDPYSAFYC